MFRELAYLFLFAANHLQPHFTHVRLANTQENHGPSDQFNLENSEPTSPDFLVLMPNDGNFGKRNEDIYIAEEVDQVAV